MVKRVIVMEVKDAYALAMEEGGRIVRIRRRDGLSVGDRIYILPEDILSQRRAHGVIPFPASGGPQERRGAGRAVWSRLGGIAAVLALLCALLLPQLSAPAYALASFDGAVGIQVELDRRGRILEAVSPDGSLSAEQLERLQGRAVGEAEAEIRRLCGPGSILVGFVPLKNSPEGEELARQVHEIFRGQPVLCLHGVPEDIAAAERSALSLGKYLILQQDDGERKAALSALPEDTLDQLFQEETAWLDEELRELLEEQREALTEDDGEDEDVDREDRDDMAGSGTAETGGEAEEEEGDAPSAEDRKPGGDPREDPEDQEEPADGEPPQEDGGDLPEEADEDEAGQPPDGDAAEEPEDGRENSDAGEDQRAEEDGGEPADEPEEDAADAEEDAAGEEEPAAADDGTAD